MQLFRNFFGDTFPDFPLKKPTSARGRVSIFLQPSENDRKIQLNAETRRSHSNHFLSEEKDETATMDHPCSKTSKWQSFSKKINRFPTLAHQRDNVFEFFKKINCRYVRTKFVALVRWTCWRRLKYLTFLFKSICIFCQFIWTSSCNKSALAVRPQICYGPKSVLLKNGRAFLKIDKFK